MKRFLTAMTSAMVLMLAAGNAAQARDGVYIAVRGGLTDYNLNNKDDSVTSSAKVDFNSVWNVSGALGYKYKYFRIEAEYIFRGDDDDTYSSKSGISQFEDKIESSSIMANIYLDLMPNYWISPYVSGGIGMTKLKLEHTNISSFPTYKQNWDKDNFTWQVGGGLSLRLNRCLNLDAGYRYVDMGSLDQGDFNAHEWYGGLRYTF
mgnify:CR=1 FL=1